MVLGALLQADGRLEASRRDAEAQVVLAEASQTAIRKVAEATAGGELPVVYLLGEKYIEAMRTLAASQNSKLVVLPADLPAAVRGVLGSLVK
jgi:regulator of protease activity HflC (stomatin/prohibitin superfamily)